LNPNRIPVAILGAGPAGAGAAYKLALRKEFDVHLLERGESVGGNSGSFDLAGIRADYGSHRLHPSCAPEILADIRRMLGADLLDRPRHGRIRLRGRWVHFPLKAADLSLHLPPSFIAGVAMDSMKKLAGRRPQGDNFAEVLEGSLGRTICRDFYFPYAWKIWGVDPETLDAEQARRRVSAGSLTKMVRKALNTVPGFKTRQGGRFFYPRRGYGAITDAYVREATAAGAQLKSRTSVASVETANGRVRAIKAAGPGGEEHIEVRQAFSTIPITQLVRAMEPAAPSDILESAGRLRFRSMILIYMVLGIDQFTEYDAHYFPGADIPITRLSEPKNYGLAVTPGSTVLCAELPCSVEDSFWKASDAELGDTMVRSLEAASLPVPGPILNVVVKRLAQAYPIYNHGYMKDFSRIDEWLDGIEGLITFGRQGLFAHDNAHHALAMAYALSECLQEDGSFDKENWGRYRRAFDKHVVED
jgi:protoporphyrinogen oxidase